MEVVMEKTKTKKTRRLAEEYRSDNPLVQQFNKSMIEMINDFVDYIKVTNPPATEIYNAWMGGLRGINRFYSVMIDQLSKEYDPANFSFDDAIKDLIFSMSSAFTGGAAATGQSLFKSALTNAVKEAGKEIIGAGESSKVQANFESPMTRIVGGTTRFLGDNPLGRTIGKAIYSLGLIFGAIDPKAEYREERRKLEMSQVGVSKYLADQFQPLHIEAQQREYQDRTATAQNTFQQSVEQRIINLSSFLKQNPELTAMLKQLQTKYQVSITKLVEDTRAFISKQRDPAVDIRDDFNNGLRRQWEKARPLFQDKELTMLPSVDSILIARKTPRQQIDWTKVFGGQPLWFFEVKK